MYRNYTNMWGMPAGCLKKILLVMKLTTMILIAAFMQVSASGLAQRLTLVQKDATIRQVFNEINKQTGYNIFWSDSQINGNTKIDVNFKDTPLPEVLDRCLEHTSLTYTLEGKTVVVKEKAPSLMDRIKKALAIPVTVSGKVIDETGLPLLGVTVKQKGTNNATVTDVKGVFSLTVPDDQSVITFSFIGFEPQELRAKDILTNSVITMKTSIANLKEVVINKGYYTDRKELETGDISSVSAKEIGEQPISNPLAALEGRVPGMFITQNTGVPGSSYAVQIRGQNSIANGNDPLYVIDGVPYTSQLLPNINNIGRSGSPFNFINPADIESVDVLKDADATAIYGSRGANGVVLINTKKGKAGKTKVDINLYSGVGKVSKMADYLNTPQYLQMRHEAFKNDGATPTVANAPDLLYWDTTRYTNWQKLLIGNTAHYDNVQGTVSGGNENTQFLIGGGYNRETTVFPGDLADTKASVHFNVNNISPNKKFKVQLSGTYLADQNDLISNDLTGQILYLPPDAPPIKNADGTLNWANSTWPSYQNPYAFLLQTYKGRTSNLVSNSILSYQIIPGLELKTNLGYTNMNTNETQLYPTTASNPAFNVVSGQSVFNTFNTQSWIVEPQASYKAKLAGGELNFLIGTTFLQNKNKQQNLLGTGFSSDALLENIQNASLVTVQSFTSNEYKYNAFFGRINYDFQDKYLFNLTARRDGSSRFGPGKQFNNFGALGVAWVFSKENFLKNSSSVLSFGKLRASYGTTGNDQLGDYRFLDLFTNTQFPYQNTQGLYPANLFNPDLAWEVTRKLEGGLELGFINNRITLNVSYYRNRSSNELVSYPISAVTGFTSIAANLPAVVQNTGLELLMSSNNVKTNDFSWSSSFNLTIPRNKLIAYPNLSTSPYAYTYIIGQPLTIRRVFHFVKINDTTGIYQFATSNGTLTYNPSYLNDATSIVNTAPKYYGGLQNSFQYRGFAIDIFFQFVRQTGANYLSLLSVPPGSEGFNQPVAVLSRWQKPGDVSIIQKFNEDYSLYNALNYVRQSDKAYSDASYIRLKNLSISYIIPESLRQKMHLQNCRIYLQGQNLLTLTKYKYFDPENQSNTSLPPLKVFTMGLQVTL